MILNTEERAKLFNACSTAKLIRSSLKDLSEQEFTELADKISSPEIMGNLNNFINEIDKII